MLVLSRKPREVIRIGNNIRITVVRIGPNSVRIGIDAPEEMAIVREELCDLVRAASPGESVELMEAATI